jgi:hypothetical protein
MKYYANYESIHFKFLKNSVHIEFLTKDKELVDTRTINFMPRVGDTITLCDINAMLEVIPPKSNCDSKLEEIRRLVN